MMDDVESTLLKLNLTEKVALLAGRDMWHLNSVPEKGIPSIRTSDGPNGVRGTLFFNGVPASCFPCGIGLAASWDLDLARKVGACLGEECRAKSAHILLGPTCNIQRSPLGGRGFESYSEDPLLSGSISAAFVNGVQSQGVSACIKHFVGNEQEFERFSSDSIVSQRALREIYLEPFRIALRESKPECFMSSYNRVNGTHVSESRQLIEGVLRKEWGFDGVVMSDWSGVYSIAESIQAGVDVEMPGPTVMRGEAVLRLIHAKKISVDDVDRCVRRVLKLIRKVAARGIPHDGPENMIDTPAMRENLRRAAHGAVVILKNNGSLPLSLSTSRSIAVIGPAGKIACPSGGGSAQLACSYTTTPLEGITREAEERGIRVEYAVGTTAFRYTPLLTPYLVGLKIDFFAEDPTKSWLDDVQTQLPAADYSISTRSSEAYMSDIIPYERLGETPRCRMTAEFTPDVSGKWELGLGSIGKTNLYIDGNLVIGNDAEWEVGELFFGEGGSQERRAIVPLEAGCRYSIEVRHFFHPDQSIVGPYMNKNGIRLGGFPYAEPAEMFEEAEALAEKCDVAIVIVGTSADWECEGFDRKTMDLPGSADELVKRILAKNHNTIVVTNSGAPVSMPWADSAPTMVHQFFSGNESGNALSDVLFGRVNPFGRLPLTFPKRLEDNPSFNSFSENKVVYGEGIFVGYPHYDRAAIEPLFPFGHGLSYTTFEYSDLEATAPTDTGDFDVSFKIANTGSMKGQHTAQIYVSACEQIPGLLRSVQKLRGFAKADLEAGQIRNQKITIGKEAFSHWDEVSESWRAEKGEYSIGIGHSSRDISLRTKVVLKESFNWTGL
ncbi:beta-glucosidase, partial [Tremellales sp. Uapishka_1]